MAVSTTSRLGRALGFATCMVVCVGAPVLAARLAWSADSLQLAQYGLRWGWPYVPPYAAGPWIDPGYGGLWYSPCYPYVSCAAAAQNERLERQRDRRLELEIRDLQQAPPMGIEAWGGWRPPQRRDAETARQEAAQVRPGYAVSGEIRKEYAGSGEFLPQFLDGSVRPPRD